MALRELELLLKLDEIFQRYFTRNGHRRYGVSVADAEPDLSVIWAELRLLKGRSYCCGEAGCHVPGQSDRLRTLATEQGIDLPESVVVRWKFIVEAGARLQVQSQFGKPAESSAYESEYVSGMTPERAALQRTPRRPPDFTGLWTEIGAGGSKNETEYVAGIKHGHFRRFSAKGVCLREGSMKNGTLNGPLILRNSDGKVLDVSEFVDGTGISRIFNACGQLSDEVPMKDGKPHGTAKRWAHGKLVELRHYIEGVCIAVNYEPEEPGI